jgi:hypothetical protein
MTVVDTFVIIMYVVYSIRLANSLRDVKIDKWIALGRPRLLNYNPVNSLRLLFFTLAVSRKNLTDLSLYRNARIARAYFYASFFISMILLVTKT